MFYVKNIKNESMRLSVAIMGTKIWNSLPIALKILNKPHLKTELRTTLFEIILLERADDYIDIDQINNLIR